MQRRGSAQKQRTRIVLLSVAVALIAASVGAITAALIVKNTSNAPTPASPATDSAVWQWTLCATCQQVNATRADNGTAVRAAVDDHVLLMLDGYWSLDWGQQLTHLLVLGQQTPGSGGGQSHSQSTAQAQAQGQSWFRFVVGSAGVEPLRLLSRAEADSPLESAGGRASLFTLRLLLTDARAPAPVPVSDEVATAPWLADLQNGSYQNPILHADYSDPDVVRVGADYYLVSSSFANVPALPILLSKDLVNWRLVGHALAALQPPAHYSSPRRGGGVWAPSIRHHAGRLLVVYPDPDWGVFMVSSSAPAAALAAPDSWSAPVLLDSTVGLIDPCPFWDDDGQAYLITAFAKSRAGFSNRLRLRRLTPDATRAFGDAAIVVDGDALPAVNTSWGLVPWTTIEGPKLYKRHGFYYILAPAGGVSGGWQAVFRAANIWGPYEGRNVMDQGQSATNGPHQGAWVDTVAGEDWFVHFQDKGAYGRVTHLQPLTWRADDWPVIGSDPLQTGRGQPVAVHVKPDVGGASFPPAVPQMSDEFEPANCSSSMGSLEPASLGVQWQWQCNPRDDWASLTAAPGALRLKSISGSGNLFEVGSLLTQKVPGPAFVATTQLRFAPRADGEQAGLLVLGLDYAWVGLRANASGLFLVQCTRVGASTFGPELEAAGGRLLNASRPGSATAAALLRLHAWLPDPTAHDKSTMRVQFSYSLQLDNDTSGPAAFTPIGAEFVAPPQADRSPWVGAQVGVFASAPAGTPSNVAITVGYADFAWFRVRRPDAVAALDGS